jgi:hypothetical protein
VVSTPSGDARAVQGRVAGQPPATWKPWARSCCLTETTLARFTISLTPMSRIPTSHPLRHRLPLGALAPLLLLLACTDVIETRPPAVLSLELAESGPLVRTLEIGLEQPAPVTVVYQTDDGPALEIVSPQALRHRVPLGRLRSARTYHFEVVGTSHRGTFQTDDLPPDLAQVGLAVAGVPSVPLVLVHLFQPDGFKGYAVTDAVGEVVWYWRTEDFPFGMTRRENGNFVFMDKQRGLVEVDPLGSVVHELAQDAMQREMHHDVIATPANTLLFIAFDTREVEGTLVKGEAIWEWWPETDDVVKRWTSWDHMSVTADRGPRFGTEWMHANALGIGPRGNVLLSVHYWNQVVSIAPGWRDIEWRLGGVNATIAVPEDEQFSGQHTAREVAPGRVVLFDNRVERGDYSRAVEFELMGDRGEKRWEWSATPPNFASAVSSARRLPNGNTLVGFGMSEGTVGSSGPTEVFEVTPDGDVVWHLVLSDVWIMYRAEPLWTIAGEERATASAP